MKSVAVLAPALALLALALPAATGAATDDDAGLASMDGRELMEAVYRRHGQYPFVYEEQSMVLVDRRGRRETRQLVRYSRADEAGRVRILLHFRFPREVQGVALLATRYPDGSSDRQVFLPALGPHLIMNGDRGDRRGEVLDDHFLGTDFSIENLTGEALEDYRYERRDDASVTDGEYYVVEVFARDAGTHAPPLRRHFILMDGLYITRTDHLDQHGRVSKRQSHHDLVAVNGDAWRANMILMDNRNEDHRTIIKIDRRIFSPDYVPEDVFTAAWIFANAPPQESTEGEVEESAAERLLRESAP